MIDPKYESCRAFADYQAGQIAEDEYLGGLAEHFCLASTDQALHLHNSILLDPYEGTLPLVQSIHAAGVRTACLSNTNDLHWIALRDCGRYPAIASLQTPGLSHILKLAKPDPAIYSAMESVLGLAGSELVFFDDVEANVEAGRARGWNAHLIDPHGDTAAQITAHLQAHHVPIK